MSFAQSQIATLTHGDEIKTFYGYDSFVEAMKAANDGDIISLSSGYFNATDITKAITLRGAGMVELNDDLGYQKQTYIEGKIIISASKNTSHTLTLEGIKFNDEISYSGNIIKPVFKKCNFYRLWQNDNIKGGQDKLTNAQFINCRIRDHFVVRGQAACMNCIMKWVSICKDYQKVSNGAYFQSPNSYVECTNCIIFMNPEVLYSNFQNCYVLMSDGYNIDPSNVVKNCVTKGSAFKHFIDPSNAFCSPEKFFNLSDTFYDELANDDCKFTLTEEAASTYLGNDGTQIGIYGGVMPYDEHTILPRITKCNVANKSTADGKLSVDIQVEAAQ